jgi:light-harvesting protein B-800-850 alpha chain
MNQGRIWCVVSPNVGLPLLLGSVAVTSLIVHASIMSHTTWMSNYWGGSKARVSMENAAPPVAANDQKTPAAVSMMVTPVPATPTAPASFLITVTPNPAATTGDDKTAQPPAVVPIRSASAN